MTPDPQKTLRDLDYSVLQQCIHCGLCLPVCPTYAETKQERHSPRGRIALMRTIADGDLALSEAFADEMYYCLGCLACMTACPAGVNYAELFETARADAEAQGALTGRKRKFIRWAALEVLFTRPRLLRFVGRLLWVWQVSGAQTAFRKLRLNNLLPSNLRRLEPQAPTVRAKFSHQLIQPVEHPKVPANPPRRVLVLTGCVQDLLFSDVNRATVDVLLANGCEVHTPPHQSCGGSLHGHNGDFKTARMLARRQLDEANPFEFDAIISNAGGCGSHLKHYGELLQHDPEYAERAAEWSRKLKDVHEYLVEIGFRAPKAPADASSRVVTYHESCHLCHGQKIRSQPRAILRSIPGLELRECVEADWCCGAAGIYGITQPITAERLKVRKAGHLLETDADLVALANPGCHLQVEGGLKDACAQTGKKRPDVTQPVVLLARAYRAEQSLAEPAII